MSQSTEPAPESIDSASFRAVVGSLATGVTILTTSDGVADFGMTASSVTSLSLEPPMMLACVNNAVPTSAAIAASGHFAVNILREGYEQLAFQFASPSDNKFRGVSVHRSNDDIPLLTDALAQIECVVDETVVGGTHTVFLALVRSARSGEGNPLTYFRGGFGRFEFSQDDDAYERARTQVLTRSFAANQVLTVDELADRLSVPSSSAFYALTRLAADGLVRRDPALGYVVTPFDANVADETFDARLAVELGVIDLAMATVIDDELAELRRRFSAMAALLVNDRFVDFDRYLDANYSFHAWMVGLAHNNLLTSTFGRLSIKSVMTRSFGSTPQSSQQFIAVQEQLTEAFERRDATAARDAARLYCSLAKARARRVLNEHGGQL